MPSNYPLIPGSLASNCYPADPQTLYNEMFAKGVAQLSSGSLVGVLISATTPTGINRDKLWVKIDGSDRPVGQFIYAGGYWLWPHEVPASGSERRLWVGSTADLLTYDGGENIAVSVLTGPMWEVDTDFAAKFPVGPGTTAGGTVIAVGGVGGEDKHTMTATELAPHTHDVVLDRDTSPPDVVYGVAYQCDGSTQVTVTSESTGDATPFNVLPPYRGCYIIKRTARVWRRAA